MKLLEIYIGAATRAIFKYRGFGNNFDLSLNFVLQIYTYVNNKLRGAPSIIYVYIHYIYIYIYC